MVVLLYLAAVPISVLLLRVFRGTMTTRNQAFRQEVESMSASVSEMIEMIPITRAHAAEDKEFSASVSTWTACSAAGRNWTWAMSFSPAALGAASTCFSSVACFCARHGLAAR